MLISGLVSVTFRNKTAEEIIRLCAENNLSAIEWGENAHVFAGDTDGSKKLRDQTLEKGLTVAAYGSYYRCDGKDGAKTDFAPSLESAAALGAPAIRVWAGTLSSEEADADYRKLIAGNAGIAAEMAADRGIKVAFEWHRNTLTDTNESAMSLLEASGNAKLRCLWQPTPELSVDERIRGLAELGGRLAHFHVYNWAERVRRPFGEEGSFDLWRQYFAAADKSENRYALLEFVMGDTENQLAADASALNSLLREISG